MPKAKYTEFSEKLKNTSAFSFRVVERRLGKGYAKLFIYNLKKRGKIIELIKGWYSFRDSPYLITVPLAEAYVGLGSAASLHNAWDQASNINVLTTRAPNKVKVGERIIAGRKVIIRRLDRRMYFGYEWKYIEEAEQNIRVSDPEKTLIDMIYFNYPFIDEIIPGIVRIIDKKKLETYLEKMGDIRGAKKVRKRVEGILGKYMLNRQ